MECIGWLNFRSEESYNVHIESMPWLRIPFTHEERRKKLAIALDVQAIPTLVILDPRDNIITLEGRAELLEDPEGLVNVFFYKKLHSLLLFPPLTLSISLLYFLFIYFFSYIYI